jgi:hypothetical protein
MHLTWLHVVHLAVAHLWVCLAQLPQQAVPQAPLLRPAIQHQRRQLVGVPHQHKAPCSQQWPQHSRHRDLPRLVHNGHVKGAAAQQRVVG